MGRERSQRAARSKTRAFRCCESWEWRSIEVSPRHLVPQVSAELAKTMAIPREGDDERLKRVARYLHGHPDYLQWYPFQEDTDTIVVTTDADWATCKEPRRSNSGGTLQMVNHLIAAWSRVQPRIALSSGEAELYAGMRGISETHAFIVWTQVRLVPSC